MLLRVEPFGFIRHMDNGLHFFQLVKRYMTFDDVPVCHNLFRRRLVIADIADSPMAAGAKWAAFGSMEFFGGLRVSVKVS